MELFVRGRTGVSSVQVAMAAEAIAAEGARVTLRGVREYGSVSTR
jgi:hypothetical protein